MIEEDSIPKRTVELINMACDGTLQPADARELDAVLASDPRAVQFYTEQVDLHTTLYFTMGTREATKRALASATVDSLLDEEIPVINQERRGRTVSRPELYLPAILAAAAAIAIAFFAFRNQPDVQELTRTILPAEAPSIPVATMTDAVAAILHTEKERPHPGVGQEINTGSYVLKQGLIELTFPDGTKSIFEAPCRFALADTHSIHLEHGKVHTRVSSGTNGFRVVSEGLEVTDLGTEFGVAITDENYAEVHVFDGAVLIRTTDDDGLGRDSMQLEEGAAVRIFRQSAAISGTDLRQDAFIQTMRSPESEYEKLVLSMNPSVYYPMSPSGEGLTVLDKSGGSAHGALKMPADGSSPWASGKFGNALRFADPMHHAFVTTPNFPRPTNDVISCAAWVYAESRPQWAMIAANWEDRRYGIFHFGFFQRSGRLDIELTSKTDETGRVHATEKQPFPLGSWQHVAFTADGEIARLYRNGIKVAQKRYNGFNNPDPELKALGVGAKLNADGSAPLGNFWHGKIDELAIFNYALTPEQITTLYQAGKE